jgi:hypothetical protein
VPLVEAHFVLGDVAHFGNIVGAANAAVALDGLHALTLDLAEEAHLRLGGALAKGAQARLMLRAHQRQAAGGGDLAD